MYLKGSLVKVEIGLARGKKNYDKRETLAKKTQQREIEKAMKREYEGRKHTFDFSLDKHMFLL